MHFYNDNLAHDKATVLQTYSFPTSPANQVMYGKKVINEERGCSTTQYTQRTIASSISNTRRAVTLSVTSIW